MNQSPQLVRDIGEQGLLKRLQGYCCPEVVGDDGAVLEIAAGQSLVVTTDVLVEQVHFSDRTTSPEDVGWRSVAANLSDLAAMGASPLGITVGLSIPGHLSVSWVESLYQGMVNCAGKYHTGILGGDISRNEVITIAITALGQVVPSRVIRRNAAQPGDAIVVSGVHGASRAGLELLLNPEWGQALDAQAQDFLRKCHGQPQPRLDVLPYLWAVKGDRSVAGMDSSDGLADAVLQICGCSGVGAEIEADAIPKVETLSPELALEWALYGGEDFELVLCLPKQPALALVELLGPRAAVIGKITPSQKVILFGSKGFDEGRVLSLTEGFQHF
ncbi:MAG: thiamine-phosphate kinase [Gomphosphaeria aponina SAG 52.96 = DSM 107014]|uniref:Thiamine-monophosphate kinase n=1 Tax=Gomphosphaeria aponina SAG 52.96 = DSM 107014 TaxID=1521640 RepID=A0A941JSX7_9CHRO|nr:thiamine-phosphate kinase [Gomphosphaeria aponina SAG 52.96 = DSM 107014]